MGFVRVYALFISITFAVSNATWMAQHDVRGVPIVMLLSVIGCGALLLFAGVVAALAEEK